MPDEKDKTAAAPVEKAASEPVHEAVQDDHPVETMADPQKPEQGQNPESKRPEENPADGTEAGQPREPERRNPRVPLPPVEVVVVRDDETQVPTIRSVFKRPNERSRHFRRDEVVVGTDRGQQTFERRYGYANAMLARIDSVLEMPMYRKYWAGYDKKILDGVSGVADIIGSVTKQLAGVLVQSGIPEDEVYGFNEHTRQYVAPLSSRWSRPLLRLFLAYDKMVGVVLSCYQEACIDQQKRDEILANVESRISAVCRDVDEYRRLLEEARNSRRDLTGEEIPDGQAKELGSEAAKTAPNA